MATTAAIGPFHQAFERASHQAIGVPISSKIAVTVAAFANAGAPLADITWRAAFGRPLDYYTGLVFEITARGDHAVLAGGGRYDRMLTLLGAQDHIPAVGFALWLDRIEKARASS